MLNNTLVKFHMYCSINFKVMNGINPILGCIKRTLNPWISDKLTAPIYPVARAV